MSAAKKRHARRKRRQSRAVATHGVAAKPIHKLKTGRTGHVNAKRTRSKASSGLVIRGTLEYQGHVYQLAELTFASASEAIAASKSETTRRRCKS